MRRNLGFTLVELMAVLVLLSVLLLMAVPSITKTLNNSTANELTEYNKTICNAAKEYNMNNNANKSINGSVKIETLRTKGYINEDLKNPKTKELEDNRTITVSKGECQ